MTVLTFPPVGGKSDKVPLNSNEQQPGQAQPPYNPKFLETGDGGLRNANRNDIGRSMARRRHVQHTIECKQSRWSFSFILLCLGCLMLLFIIFDLMYRTVQLNLNYFKQNTDEDDAAVPCKSYSSYEAAESDMLPLQPSSSAPDTHDMVFSMVINPVEETTDKVPPIVINKSARFVHDFSVNITGIVDLENHCCYVMPLIRISVEPPESLYDLLIKMSSGYYSSDINKLLLNFHVVKPAVNDLSGYGMYISKDCADYPTFKLEKDTVTESPQEVY